MYRVCECETFFKSREINQGFFKHLKSLLMIHHETLISSITAERVAPQQAFEQFKTNGLLIIITLWPHSPMITDRSGKK